MGEEHPMAVVNDSMILDIRTRYRSGMTVADISEELGIEREYIKEVVTCRTRTEVATSKGYQETIDIDGEPLIDPDDQREVLRESRRSKRFMMTIPDRQLGAIERMADRLEIGMAETLRRILDDYPPLWSGNGTEDPNGTRHDTGDRDRTVLSRGDGPSA